MMSAGRPYLLALATAAALWMRVEAADLASVEEAHSMLEEGDADKNGKLSLAELHALEEVAEDEKEELQEEFKKADLDGDEHLDHKELAAMIEAFDAEEMDGEEMDSEEEDEEDEERAEMEDEGVDEEGDEDE